MKRVEVTLGDGGGPDYDRRVRDLERCDAWGALARAAATYEGLELLDVPLDRAFARAILMTFPLDRYDILKTTPVHAARKSYTVKLVASRVPVTEPFESILLDLSAMTVDNANALRTVALCLGARYIENRQHTPNDARRRTSGEVGLQEVQLG